MPSKKQQPQIENQPASHAAWRSKYALPSEKKPEDTYARVAHALAQMEGDVKKWEPIFRDALARGATPAGRILANLGAGETKSGTSTINCTVSCTVRDSIGGKNGTPGGISWAVAESMMTLSAGCGIGYDFSTLRPEGAFVHSVGASTSGALSFMSIFDVSCGTISSAGGRRGAQMGTLDVRHPDVFAFISAKRTAGAFTKFNLSLLITDSFIEAVRNDDDWMLMFPLSRPEADRLGITDPNDADNVIWTDWPTPDQEASYFRDADGRIACRIYKTIKARTLWDEIMQSTYDWAEPGFILIDRVNEMNNLWFCEDIRATNPCGEQPLPPYGACLLGSVNLTKFVNSPCTDSAKFDWAGFEEVCVTFSRMLDLVADASGLPLPQQREEILRKRRHGMGFLGLGSAMNMLGIAYGGKDGRTFATRISQTLAKASWTAALDLAKEKGPAPIMDEMFEVTPAMMRMRPEMAEDGVQVGDKMSGRVLCARYSRHLRRLRDEGILSDEWLQSAEQVGLRYSHATSIAPTGTISFMSNNCSNGIEPTFDVSPSRRMVVRDGRKTKEMVDVLTHELAVLRAVSGDEKAEPPAHWDSAQNLSVDDHVGIMRAVQPYIDSSISKTVNVPMDMPFEDFSHVYMDAYDCGLKGCTTYRPRPDVRAGVLATAEQMETTYYEFRTESGELVRARADEMLLYDGEETSAAALFEALNQGYYGKGA